MEFGHGAWNALVDPAHRTIQPWRSRSSHRQQHRFFTSQLSRAVEKPARLCGGLDCRDSSRNSALVVLACWQSRTLWCRLRTPWLSPADRISRTTTAGHWIKRDCRCLLRKRLTWIAALGLTCRSELDWSREWIHRWAFGSWRCVT